MDESVLHIIEDHALVEDFIFRLSRRLQEGKPVPEDIPCIHSSLMMDALGNICEYIMKAYSSR